MTCAGARDVGWGGQYGAGGRQTKLTAPLLGPLPWNHVHKRGENVRLRLAQCPCHDRSSTVTRYGTKQLMSLKDVHAF